VLRAWVPGPPLSEFVELLWLLDDGFTHDHTRERLLPTGSMELVISLCEDDITVYDDEDAPLRRLTGCSLSGAFSKYYVIDTLPTDRVIGVHFKPGGAFPFFRMPAGELHNMHVALEDVWDATAARELRERLLAAPAPEAKFAVLEEALIAQAGTLERDAAVVWAVRELSRSRSVGDVTQQIGVSAARFISLFAAQTGYTPKKFARVQRFQRVLRRVHAQLEIDWTDVALSCGYFDQSHFIRDFRAFSGVNPTTYFADRTRHQNHLAIR
jgi:AraC-like DNA-binding protein